MAGTSVTKDLTLEASEADEAEKLSQSLGTLRCLDWMVERIRLKDAVYPIEIDDDQRFAGVDFLTSAKANKVFVFLQNGTPVMQMTLPDDGTIQEVFYFLKDALALSKFITITPENIGQVITFGTVHGKVAIDELHNLMKQFFVPNFRSNTTWPDTLKKDISSQTSRFMSSLTETVHALRGATVLYVPEENLSDMAEASQNKDLVQRLESTIIHWTRQIKGVLGGSDSSGDSESSTLLVEIDAWKSRVDDLSGVQEQLQREEVGQIINTLQLAKSSYLTLFLSLKEQIMKGYQEAMESLKFLSIFKEPCTTLNTCSPQQCEQLLSQVFSLVRFVWNTCGFYSTEERVTSLMRKFCNQVIECFSRYITIKETIFKNVEHAKAKLEECIHCGEMIHVCFEKMCKAISLQKDECPWSFEKSRVFAQLDAFIQRCRDLNEVCRWRLQFESLRWSFSPAEIAAIATYEEAKAALPLDNPEEAAVQTLAEMAAEIPKLSKVVFGGSQGGDVEKSLDNIRLEFQKSVSLLGQLPYNALDVKAPNWHVDLADFKSKTKDLEVMFLNVLQGAVTNCGSIAMKIDRLECFREISLRDTIIQSIDKHTRDLIVAHSNELLAVQKEFDRNRRDPAIAFNNPKYAGAAIWARCFKRRVQREMDNLAQYWPIVRIREYSDARVLSEALATALGDYITKMNADWMSIAENVGGDVLELHIMIRFERGLLKMNFDSSLLRLYREVETWESLHFNIPFAAMELTKNRDSIRALRESVLGVVREYNDILNSMDAIEMKIFAEKVRAVDRKILNGVNKLAWIHKGQVESFCKEGGKLCKNLLELVRDFKKKRAVVQACLVQIADLQLVHIERKRVYEEGQFEQCQVDHRSAMATKLESLALEIRETLKTMFFIVSLDPVDVQREWDKFVASVDHSLEEALKQSIKRSYHIISRAINGDKSHDVQPIFKVNVLLEKSGSDHNASQKVEFKPSMQSLTEMVNSVCKEIISIISVVTRNRHRSEVAVREQEIATDPTNERLVADLARRRELLEATLRREKGASIQENISNDEEVLRIMVSIFSGMSSSVDKLQKYLTFWEKYKHIWDLDKEAFVRRYVRNPRPLKSVQDDIQKYRDIQREVQSEEGLVMINFISSDASLLKQSIIKHCVEWQAKFTDHINSTARAELSALLSLFETKTASLLRNPKTLDELSDVNVALKDIQANSVSIHARFDPLKQQYNMLEYFEVRVKEDELAGLQSLPQLYEQLQTAISVCEKKVVDSKRVMKKELERNVAVFDKDLDMLNSDMKNRAPFSDVGTSVQAATSLIEEFRKQMQSIIDTQSNLNKGLAIFDVDPMSRKEIVAMTKDLEMLDVIWKYFGEWEELWKSLSVQPIDVVDISTATTKAASMLKSFLKATREVKDWDAIKGFKTQLEKVKANFPIIQSLQSKNFRERHWLQLQKVVGHELGEKKACKFDAVVTIDFSKFSDALLNICSIAAQEVAIETSIGDLESQWDSVRLNIDKYKDRGHKIVKGLPAIFSVLDESSVMLSSLKVSPHHVPFKAQIHEWELCLSTMSEALEAVSHVQKLWIYLESIFVSSDDSVNRQLPAEAATFERVDNGIRVVMDQMQQNPLVKAALCSPTILPELAGMGKDLESVRKNLEDFLETKRQAFSRFYFVSNDDVLEVLGCNKDLKTMQPHVKKIFPNVASLLLKQNQRKIYEVEGISSGEDEQVAFGNVVAADGPVEHWMLQVDESIKVSIRHQLGSCIAAFKASKKEKWIAEWAGQLLVTASLVHWTSDGERMLVDYEKGAKGTMRATRKKWHSNLAKWIELVPILSTPVDRSKLMALIVINVHCRDIFDRLAKAGVSNQGHFDWISQLRFIWDKESENCSVIQDRCVLTYGGDYIGNGPRLVITPLTDRVYLTLTTAMSNFLGGSPQGPAGTGKTETVRDLARSVAKVFSVINCSEQFDSGALCRVLLGTCTQGGWTCFDEINRVRVDVLSVFAQQVITVLSGLRDGSKTIRLDGQQISFLPQVGLFTTMIPDETDPHAIPDSLSVLFRPVAMTLPDVSSIAEVSLYSFGFTEAKSLGRKIVLVLQIMANQMTRQSHYDKSLRAVKTILNTAGFLMSKKEAQASEDSIVITSVCLCTEPKLVAEDREIFKGIIADVFPLEEVPVQEESELQTFVQDSMSCAMPDRYKGRFRESAEHEVFVSKAATSNEVLVKKIMQLNSIKNNRGSFIVIGDASSGKTTALSALSKALNQMSKESTGGVSTTVRIQKFFVKVFTISELYGYADSSGVWQDGLLSRCIRSVSNDDNLDEKWIVLDGTNDATWMETLNSVLDNSKLMSLPSGERISIPSNVHFVFESLNLAAATPATVSRAGVLYMDAAHLTWHAWFLRWLDARPRNDLRDALQTTFERVVPNIIAVVMNVCVFPVPYSESALVRSLCSLLEAFLLPENGVGGENKDAASLADAIKLQDMWLLFCIAWSFGGAIEEEGRIRVDMLIRELDSGIPSKLTVFDLWVDPKKLSWVSWEDRVTSFRPSPGTPFKNMMVSTPDTIRLNYIVSHLCKIGRSSLVIGPSGTGKSAIVRNMLSSNSENFLSKYVLLSHSTTSQSLQDRVFAGLEKRSKDVWGPALSKKMVAFVDDVNLPAADAHSTQPALEALRQLLDVSVLYDRQRLAPLQIQDITYVCAATLSTDLKRFPIRLASLVPVINSGSVKDASIKRIFSSLVAAKFADFDDSVRSSVDALANAMIDLNRNVASSLLPNPSKSHYIFSLQDVVKVAEGFSVLQPSAIDSKDLSLKFFCSEVMRVYAGRLTDMQDRAVLKKILDEAAQAHMDSNLRGIFTSSKGDVVPFVNFLRNVENQKGPEESSYADMKVCLDQQFSDYLSSTGAAPFTMVFFKEAIVNIATTAHVLKIPRATSMQVGLGSSGRTTLTKLASFMLGYEFQTPEIRKDLKLADFRDALKSLIMNAVTRKQHTTFLFKEEHIIEESFFENVYSFISSSEISGLLSVDDWRAVSASFPAEPNGPSVQAQFWAAAGEYVHVVLCFSPEGNSLRSRLRQYPCLLGCCSVSWLLDWQQDSLKEISAKLTENVKFDTPALQSAFVNSISSMHELAVNMAARSLKETGRLNVVTPGHFLEFSSNFASVYSEKKAFFESSIVKFENGLKKLDQAKQEIEDVSVVLAKKKKEVEAAQKECEELLLVIVHEKRVCEDQEAHISAQAEKIKGEAETCMTIAAAAQADLEKAMPALQNALKALDSLNKSDISEIKMYAKPPDLVMLTLSAVLVLRRASSLEWAEAQKHLSDPSFLKQLVDYEKDTLLNDAMLKKLEKYIDNPQFDPEKVGKVSKAAMSLCLWSRAMYSYGLVNKAVVPKKEKAAAALGTLEKKQAALAESQEGLRKVQEKLATLKEKYDSSVGVKEKLKADCDALEARSAKALNLIKGLGAERTRWQETIVVLKDSLLNSLGNSVVSAGFLAYAGPLSEAYRKELLDDQFVQNITKSKVRVSQGLNIPSFLVPVASIRDWNVYGLSSDAFSIQNAVLVQKYVRWPLIIDPQSQAMKWLSNMHKDRLAIVDPKIDGWMRALETCITMGNVALLLITDFIDPVLDPLLSKAVFNKDGVLMLKCFGKQLVYHNKFELILSSRLPNPTFSAALCTQTSIVNFCIKDQGLEEQLLSLIVKKERFDLEEQKQILISKSAQCKNQLEELQDSILKMLSTLEGSLLDNDAIVGVLQESKSTAESISEQLANSEVTEQEIDEARQLYYPIAARCALLFLVVNDLCMVDHMYQFSLESYCDLVHRSLDKSHKTDVLSDRVNAVNEWHTYSTFRFACRALFEKDKPALALKLCAKILESQKRLNRAEWQFFLRGGVVTNREAQPPRPVDWLTASAWDNITELEKLPAFRDIVSAFEQSSSDWFEWYSSNVPEDTVLPGEWASKLNELQRLVLVRCVRPDRVGTAASKIVVSNMGAKYVETVPTDIATAYLEASSTIPLIFVLADGVDPLSALQLHADKCSASGSLKVELKVLALGHGQESSAERIIAEGVKSGHWVYLRNCHLLPDWMPNLERIFNNVSSGKPHKNFRLWLSSKSNSNFPIGILQRGVKIVLEQQNSVRAIMGQHYSRFSVDNFAKCSKPSQYKKLLFSLSFLHATVVQRQRYGSCGWKRPYHFSDADFELSERILQHQLNDDGELPWSALHTLIADVTYGNRVTDELDMKVLRVLVKQCLSSSSITVDSYKLSDNELYTVPQDGSFPSYLDHIRSLPTVDSSEAFGLNRNSDTEYMARTSLYLISTLDSMNTKLSAGADEEKVNERLSAIVNQLLAMLPAKFNIQAVQQSKEGSDHERSPLDNFLIRELECFNRLLLVMRQTLEALRLGLQGLVLMTSDLDQALALLDKGQVPPSWRSFYLSMKSLGPWMTDLLQRVDAVKVWAEGASPPKAFWMGGFCDPIAFAAAVQQTAVRKLGAPYDALIWEFVIINSVESDIKAGPREGVFVKGLLLEGAGWDMDFATLVEAPPMKMLTKMPIIHMKLIESKKKVGKGVYSCPCYVYPDRHGSRDKPSYVMNFDLKSGKNESEFWLKRGAALLLSSTDDF